MKLLFDQNLSPSLLSRLADVFPGSNHVFPLGLDQALDSEIREFAAANDFIIVTKDADYSELHSLRGAPPKIIWIRRGNCSTSVIEEILRHHYDDVLALTTDDTAGVLTIF
jgi:predicted nuclease of predicted toxin-antitoxin system